MVLLKSRVPLALLLMPATVLAAPGGATVTQGTASVTTDGSTTTVTNTPGAIIHWERFSVAPDEITRFVQQNASSAVLNRVTGSQGSEILGQLLSNGRVFVINPNGIAIGAGARIDTAGFVASSLDIADADFLSGRERFEGTGQEGRVVNRGSIEAGPGGSVYLIAPNVENSGVIRAPGGEILLAAGHSAELVSSTSPNLRVRINAPEPGAAVNVGELVAKAGRIGLFGAVVSAGGVLDASSASRNANGEIVLVASGDALVEAGARVDVANTNGGGGTVIVEGARVAVLDGALIDASGITGGGDIRVGGDALGSGASVRNASATVIAPTATLRADASGGNASGVGDGGRVIVWSDDYTGFHGSISARGGALGGDGGFVETSSAGNLQALGTVDASAPAGTAGEWLLDPYNITINTSANSNGSFNGGSPNLFTPTGNSAVANRDAIQASLNSGTSVTVSTGGTGSPGTQAGTLTVAAPITKTGGGNATLSLNAASTISFSAGAAVTSTAGALGLSLATTGGAITNLPNIDLNGGTLTLSSTATSTQVAGGVISGNTSVVKAGTSAFQLRAGQSYTGTTTINGGSLQLTAANALPDSTAVTINSGTLNLANFSDTVGSVGGAGGVSLGSGTLTTGGNNASTTLGGLISGTGGLVKNGTGTFTLGGNNTYSGATSINAGTLQLGAANRIANNSAVTVATGASLALNGFAETLGSLSGDGSITLGSGSLTVGSGNVSSTFNGVISGTGGLTKGGTGTFTLGGANTWSGATSITGGTLQLGGSERIANNSAVTLSAGTTLALSGFNESVGSLAGSGTVSLGAGTLTTGLNGTSTTYSGVLAGTGTVTKLGAGTFTLSGVNTFTGALNVQAGTLGFGSANRLTGGNAVTISPGASLLLNNNSQTLGSLSGTGNVTLGSGTLTSGTNGGSTAYGGVISGTGGLAKSGTGVLTLTGANTYTGATTINAGTLRLGAAERLSNSSALNVLAGATFDLNGSSETVASMAGAGSIQLGTSGATLATAGTTTTAFSGVLAGTGNLTKGGTGTLTLSGANSYTGATQVNAGTLIAANATALGGTATGTTVASGATLRVSNAAVGNENVTLSGNGVSNAGALTGDGTASLAGNVTLAAASRIGTTNAASSLTLGGTVNGAFALTPVGAGTVALNGVVGGTTPLASLSQGATVPLRIGTNSVTTTGAQAYAGPLTLASDVTLRSTANGAITLANVTGGGFDITAMTGGATTLNNLSGVDVLTTDAPGTVTLNGNVLASTVTIGEAAPSVCGQVGSGGGAVSFAGAVSLCGTTTVSATDVQFNGAIESNAGGARALTVNASSTTNFIGLVGATSALASLATNGTGVSRFSAGTATQATVRTTGAQTYNQAVQLVATAAAQPRTFTSTAAGAIGFAGTVDAAGSGAANLTINTAGQTTLAGAIGASPLNAVTTDAAGTLSITAPSIRTVGSQLYGDAATQSGTTTFESTGNGDVSLANAGNDLSIVGVTAARNVTLVDTNGLTLAGSNVSNALSVNTGGALVQTGAILSSSLVAQAGGNAVLTNPGNDVDVLTLQSGGAASFTDSDDLSIANLNATGVAAVTSTGSLALNGDAQANSLALRSTSADVVLGNGRSLLATGGGSSIVLDAAARFVNNGATLSPGPGRWVIYSADPALDVFGGLASGQVPVWGATSGTLAPGLVPAGNRYVFAAGRTLTFASTDVTKTYGDDASALLATAWSVSGFNSNTYGGAILADSAASTFSGAPLLDSPGAPVTAQVAGAPYAIGISNGSLSALTGYSLAFDSVGLLYVDPRAANVIANNGTKIYGEVDPVLTFTTTGFVNGDTPGGALRRVAGETVSGSPYTILQGTLANTNYTITYTGADFVITRRPVQVVADNLSKAMGAADPALTYVATGLVGSDLLTGALVRRPGESYRSSPYLISQGTLVDAANPNYTIGYTPGYLTIEPGEVSPYSPVVEVALERAAAQPFVRSCLAVAEEDVLVLEGGFTDAQARLDRASKGLREVQEAPAICVTRAN